jgi:carbon-monoxide dehydrogenase medium subunit
MTHYNPLEVFRPSSSAEAVTLLNSLGSSVRLVAGNTTLYEFARQGALADVVQLIDMERLGLNYVRRDPDSQELCIGAMTTFSQMTISPLLGDPFYHAIPEAASKITPPQIRNTGTMGGSLCSGIPFYDMPPAVLALSGKVKAMSVKGERLININDFFQDYFVTALSPGEMVLEVRFPRPPQNSASSFRKLGRTSVDFAVVNVATFLSVDPSSGKVSDARIALGAVSNVVTRAREAENVLIGRELDADSKTIQEASEAAAADLEPSPSVHASSSYKKRVIPVIVRDTLMQTSSKLKNPYAKGGGMR